MKLSISENQQAEMGYAHRDGAPGILVSGLVWLCAALVCHLVGIKQGVWTLLIGGALIYPISAVLTKMLGRPAKTAKDNALNQLAMASTIWLIVGCAMSYGLYVLAPFLFFPAMMATIGSRYLIFASVYGKAIFWIIGATLIAAGNFSYLGAVPPVYAAAIGGFIEVVFAIVVFARTPKVAVQ
jgi:hypothetical protein